MNAVPSNDDPMTVEEQAGSWCLRLAGPLSPFEQAEFDAWLAAEPAHAEAFDRALLVWHGLGAIADTPETIAARADALDAMRRANRARWSRNLFGRWRWPLALAASIVLVAAVSIQLFSMRPDTYVTGLGERRAVVLADGSRISLDARTEVSVDLSDDQRSLRLISGRAKFDVAHDATRPFTVTALGQTFVATGTAFSVEVLNGKVHLIVYQGHVATVHGDVPALGQLRQIAARERVAAEPVVPVEAGRELVATAEAVEPILVAPTDITRSLSWQGGQLDFVDEPLGDAVERLNRYAPAPIVVTDPKAARIPINGVFNAGDSAAFVEAVISAYPVRVRQEGAKVTLKSR